MKRLMAVGAMVGILLAASTAAFATPVRWESTLTTPDLPLTTGFTQLTWTQSYTPYDAAHPGSTLDDPILWDAGHLPTLTIESSNVVSVAPYGPEDDYVYRGSVLLGKLNLDSAGPKTFDLTQGGTINPNSWLKGTTGFSVKVTFDGQIPDYAPTTIKKATLVVWTEWTDNTPPPVPAPAALLLASLGAGLVSLLRTRKVF